MALNPNAPQRDMTPQERQRSVKTFWLILLLLPTVIGTMVAYLSVKGRQVRDYGQSVIQAVQSSSSKIAGPTDCTAIQQLKTPPRSVKSCTVVPEKGGLVVTLNMENGQQYRVTRP